MNPLPRQLFRALAAILVTLLAACTTPSAEFAATGQPFDPNEQTNRKIHRFNVAVDEVFFRPASRGYTNLVPDPIEDSFNNFAANISAPGDTVNFLAQGNLREAGIAFGRFLINSTIGFAGLANPASDFGIPEAQTDFGETLHVWGVAEGAYVELPFIGPSTQRDAVGTIVDLFTNPITLTPQNPLDNVGLYAEVVERLSDRGRFSDTVDSILYESVDSYAQARLIYLQNRRFELGQADEANEIDPFELDTQGF